ncbi:MAG TPA: hypothetical protein VF345_05895 [Chthoniobacterales bacterium]
MNYGIADLLQQTVKRRTYAMDLKKFVADLKRRNLYKIAVAYAVTPMFLPPNKRSG